MKMFSHDISVRAERSPRGAKSKYATRRDIPLTPTPNPHSEAPMTLRVLDPTFDDDQATQAAVSRLSSLAGRTVGLLDNGKLNVDILLDHVETLLRTQHGVGNVIRLHKPDASRPVPEDVAQGFAACDAVISAVGD